VHYAREICPVTTTSRDRPATVTVAGRVERLLALQVADLNLLANRKFDLPLRGHAQLL
jgi:hypothetical protein